MRQSSALSAPGPNPVVYVPVGHAVRPVSVIVSLFMSYVVPGDQYSGPTGLHIRSKACCGVSSKYGSSAFKPRRPFSAQYPGWQLAVYSVYIYVFEYSSYWYNITAEPVLFIGDVTEYSGFSYGADIPNIMGNKTIGQNRMSVCNNDDRSSL